MFRKNILCSDHLYIGSSLYASGAEIIKLPPPQLNSGKSLMQAAEGKKIRKVFCRKKNSRWTFLPICSGPPVASTGLTQENALLPQR